MSLCCMVRVSAQSECVTGVGPGRERGTFPLHGGCCAGQALRLCCQVEGTRRAEFSGCVLAASPCLCGPVCSSARWAAGCLSMSRSAPRAPGEALVWEHAAALVAGGRSLQLWGQVSERRESNQSCPPSTPPSRIPHHCTTCLHRPPPALPLHSWCPPPAGPWPPLSLSTPFHRPRPPASSALVRFHLPQEPVSARVSRETEPHPSFQQGRLNLKECSTSHPLAGRCQPNRKQVSTRMWRNWMEPVCIAGGSGGWHSRCGKWYGGSSKFKRTIVIRSRNSASGQTPHRKQGLNGIFAHTRDPNSTIHKERRGGSDPSVHRKTNGQRKCATSVQGCILNLRKEGHCVTCYNVDELRGQYTK